MSKVIRTVREEEKELLTDLAKHDPENHDSYIQQIRALTTVQDWDDGTNSITLLSDRDKEIRAEAIAEDEDGAQIEVMLWAVDGKICMLEMFRSDGERTKRYPSPPHIKDVWDAQGNPRPEGW